MSVSVALTVAVATLSLVGDFPLDQWQAQQADELFAGLQGHYQEGTQARMSRVAWLYDDQNADPVSVSVDRAKKLVQGCALTGKSQSTRESVNYFMICSGRNEGILFRVSDGRIVVGEIINPPPIIVVLNPAEKK